MPKINHFILRDKETSLYYDIGDWVKLNKAYNYTVECMRGVTIGATHEWFEVKKDGKIVKIS